MTAAVGLSRRTEIMDRAAALFAEQGVAVTSMADIAAAVGIRKASLYHFYPSKGELLMEVLRPVVQQPYVELNAIVDGPGTVRDRFIEGMAALGRAFEQQGQRMQVLVRERLERHLSPAGFEEIRGWKWAYTELWHALVREGVETGVFRPTPDTITVFGLLGSLNWMYAWFDPEGQLRGEEVGRELAALFLTGLLADGGPDGSAGNTTVADTAGDTDDVSR